MLTVTYPRGSEWRKWDLHVHGPEDRLQNDWPGATPDDKWNSFVAALEASGLSVIGLTNYFCCDGYERMLHYKEEGRLRTIELIVPNIELRITQPNRCGEYINLHVLFEPRADAKKITGFLGRLPQVATSHANTRLFCSKEDLSDIGFDKALVSFEELRDRLKAEFRSGEVTTQEASRGGMPPDGIRRLGLALPVG